MMASVTVMVLDSTSGPVMATGERDSPLRRQASAAAVAIGPGMPFTMILSADASAPSFAIWRQVALGDLWHCCVDWRREKPYD